MEFVYRSVGTINTPHKEKKGMPIQPSGAAGVMGRVIIDDEFVEGLSDIEGFSHVVLLYHFHECRDCRLTVKPFLDDELHGVFAVRAPCRPNPIGLSVVRLLKREGNVLHVEGVDMLDSTPLLDLKPYVPEFDSVVEPRLGWLAGKKGKSEGKRSDGRF